MDPLLAAEPQHLADDILAWQAGDFGDEVTLTDVIQWHMKRMAQLASPVPPPSADFKCYRCDKPLKPLETMEMCPACYEAVDLEPPKPPSADAVKDMRVEQNAFVDREIENSMRPRPSADARAKLEQAHARWKAAKEADYAEPTVRTRLALEAAEHNLFHLALPPHEGETPQPGISLNLWAQEQQQLADELLAWQSGDYGDEVTMTDVLNWHRDRLLRALAHRAALPETPQPAAESDPHDLASKAVNYFLELTTPYPDGPMMSVEDQRTLQDVIENVLRTGRAEIFTPAAEPSGWRDRWQTFEKLLAHIRDTSDYACPEICMDEDGDPCLDWGGGSSCASLFVKDDGRIGYAYLDGERKGHGTIEYAGGPLPDDLRLAIMHTDPLLPPVVQARPEDQ